MNSITKSVFIYEQVFTQQFQVLCSNNLRGNILVLVGVSHPLTDLARGSPGGGESGHQVRQGFSEPSSGSALSGVLGTLSCSQGPPYSLG